MSTLVLSPLFLGWLVVQPLGAAEQGTYPGNKYDQAYWLGHVGISPHLQKSD